MKADDSVERLLNAVRSSPVISKTIEDVLLRDVRGSGNTDKEIIHRLQEMEYATIGGNSEGDPVPADVLSRWFCYVMGGEAQQ